MMWGLMSPDVGMYILRFVYHGFSIIDRRRGNVDLVSTHPPFPTPLSLPDGVLGES